MEKKEPLNHPRPPSCAEVRASSSSQTHQNSTKVISEGNSFQLQPFQTKGISEGNSFQIPPMLPSERYGYSDAAWGMNTVRCNNRGHQYPASYAMKRKLFRCTCGGKITFKCLFNGCEEKLDLEQRAEHMKKHGIYIGNSDIWCSGCESFFPKRLFKDDHLLSAMNPLCEICQTKSKVQETSIQNSKSFRLQKAWAPNAEKRLTCVCENGHISCFKGFRSFNEQCWCLTHLRLQCPCGTTIELKNEKILRDVVDHLNSHKNEHGYKYLDACQYCKDEYGILFCDELSVPLSHSRDLSNTQNPH